MLRAAGKQTGVAWRGQAYEHAAGAALPRAARALYCVAPFAPSSPFLTMDVAVMNTSRTVRQRVAGSCIPPVLPRTAHAPAAYNAAFATIAALRFCYRACAPFTRARAHQHFRILLLNVARLRAFCDLLARQQTATAFWQNNTIAAPATAATTPNVRFAARAVSLRYIVSCALTHIAGYAARPCAPGSTPLPRSVQHLPRRRATSYARCRALRVPHYLATSPSPRVTLLPFAACRASPPYQHCRAAALEHLRGAFYQRRDAWTLTRHSVVRALWFAQPRHHGQNTAWTTLNKLPWLL